MIKRLTLLLLAMILLEGCSENPKIEYTYPKNSADRDSEKVGSLVPGGGLYLIKPKGVDK